MRFPRILVLGLVLALLLLTPLGAAHGAWHAAGATPASPFRTATASGSVEWASGDLTVLAAKGEAAFSVEYTGETLFGTYQGQNLYNYSFSIPWLAEVSPAGAIVRVADPLAPRSDLENVTTIPGQVIVAAQETVNVTNATGSWTPATVGSVHTAQLLGTAVLQVVFHLFRVSGTGSGNASYTARFDIDLLEWPWASGNDRLGVAFDSPAPTGAHTSYNATSRTLGVVNNATGHGIVGVEYSRSAIAAGSFVNPIQNASVQVQVGQFTGSSPNPEALTLLTFTNASGYYPTLIYDPWIHFSPVRPPAPPAPARWPPWLVPVVPAAAVAVVGVSAIAIFFRRRRLRREGQELVQGMRAAIAAAPSEPKPHR